MTTFTKTAVICPECETTLTVYDFDRGRIPSHRMPDTADMRCAGSDSAWRTS